MQGGTLADLDHCCVLVLEQVQMVWLMLWMTTLIGAVVKLAEHAF
jgi:hypothetical protein